MCNKWIFLFLIVFISITSFAKDGDSVVKKLIKLGFENVCCGEDEKERVYVVENVAYRLEGVGIGKAVDIIQAEGMPIGKKCCIIILDNNVPTLSLVCDVKDTNVVITRNDWNISYELNESWGIVKNIKKENSSLYKVDLTFYPEFSFRNIKLSVMYEFLFNITPTIEVSLWKGSRFSAQYIIPIFNQFGYRYRYARPGIVSLSQTFRLPKNIFFTGTIGMFNGDRWGADAKVVYHLKNERFWVDARLSYTGVGQWGYWKNFELKSPLSFKTYGYWRATGSIGFNYFVPKIQSHLSIHAERYLLGEYGARFDAVRYFKYCSIGLYATKIQYAGNKGYNGGFKFLICLPPYKYKRDGMIRVMPSKKWGIIYNAGNEFNYGHGFKPQPSENFSTDMNFNPYYVKQELMNF